MIKKYKKTLILASIVTLLPMIFGLIFWNNLPDIMPTHWGINNEANGYSEKIMTVVILPLILLLLEWFGVFITSRDKNAKKQSEKAVTMAFWIVPLLSIFVSSFIYAISMGWVFSVQCVTFIFLAIVFIVTGNYLPKCRQNYYLGIKVKWALENEENWNATHRFSGKLWVICGIITLFFVFLPETLIPVGLISILIPTAIIPPLYSYLYYKKQMKAGTYEKKALDGMKGGKIAAVIIALVVVLLAVVMFTGDIFVELGEDSLKLSATYWQETEIYYDEITEIEYRETFTSGRKTGGFDSAKLHLGTFSNDEFKLYGIYKYTNSESAIVLKNDNGGVIVISADTTENTKTLYEEILAKIN